MSLLGRNISNFLNSVGITDSISVRDYGIKGGFGVKDAEDIVDDKELGQFEEGIVHRKKYGKKAYVDRDVKWKKPEWLQNTTTTVTMVVENATVQENLTLEHADTDFHMSTFVKDYDVVLSPPAVGETTKISYAVDGRPVVMEPIEIPCTDRKSWLKGMDKALTDLKDMSLEEVFALEARVKEPDTLFIPAEICDLDYLSAHRHTEEKPFYNIKDIEKKGDGYEVSFLRFGENARDEVLEHHVERSKTVLRGFLSSEYRRGHLLVAEKKGKVLVRGVVDGEKIPVYTKDGNLEVEETGQEGNLVLTRCDDDGRPIVDAHGHTNAWQADAEKFAKFYDLDGETGIATPKKVRQRFVQVDRDIVIYKPWGEDREMVPQVIRAGGYVNVEDGKGIAKEEFEETYVSHEASENEKTADAISFAVDRKKYREFDHFSDLAGTYVGAWKPAFIVDREPLTVRIPVSLIKGREICCEGRKDKDGISEEYVALEIGGKPVRLYRDFRETPKDHVYHEGIEPAGKDEYGEDMVAVTFAPFEKNVAVLGHISEKLLERQAQVEEWMKDVTERRETVKDTAVLLDRENTDTCLHVLENKDVLRSDNDSVYLTTAINDINAELQDGRLGFAERKKALERFVKDLEAHSGECYVENGLVMEKDKFCVEGKDGVMDQIIPVKGVPGVFIHMSQKGDDISTFGAEVISLDGKKTAENLGNMGYTVKERTSVLEFDWKSLAKEGVVTYCMANGKTACDVRVGDRKESSLARSADRQKSLQRESEQDM